MNHDTDLDWLLERWPDPAPPSRTSTEHARAALLAHGAKRRRDRRRSVTAAVGVTAVAGIGLAVGLSQLGHPPAHRHARLGIAPRTVTPVAGAAPDGSTPLVRLAADVRRLAPGQRRGNATLVARYTVLNGHHSINGVVYGGYDLYTDSGRYYWAPDSLRQLRQLVTQRPSHSEPGDEARTLRRIAAAAGRSPAQARSAVLGHVTAPLSTRHQTPEGCAGASPDHRLSGERRQHPVAQRNPGIGCRGRQCERAGRLYQSARHAAGGSRDERSIRRHPRSARQLSRRPPTSDDLA